jgi:licheninase
MIRTVSRKIMLPLALTLGIISMGGACSSKKSKTQSPNSRDVAVRPVKRPLPNRRVAPPPTPIRPASPGIFDQMNRFNSRIWHRANGWKNGDPFDNGWRNDHVLFRNGAMVLRLSNDRCPSACSGKPYVSGELRSNQSYRYGLLEGRIKVAKGPGTATSLFFYTGTYGKTDHHEIDIEFLGKDTTKMQVNYYVRGQGKHEKIINLGFDASQGFHTYGIRWGKTSIQWTVNGRVVHTVTGSASSIPNKPAKIMMNLWPGIKRNDIIGWLGRFFYRKPIAAFYDWIKFTPQ